MKSHNSITSLVKPAQAILSHYAQATTKGNHKQRAGIAGKRKSYSRTSMEHPTYK